MRLADFGGGITLRLPDLLWLLAAAALIGAVSGLLGERLLPSNSPKERSEQLSDTVTSRSWPPRS